MKWISFFAVSSTVFLNFSFALAVSSKDLNAQNAVTHKAMSSKEEKKLYLELTGKDYSKLSEQVLYSQMISAYQTQDELKFYAQFEAFQKKFKKSVYFDNALYLAGRLALEKKNYAKAVFYFDRILKSYPESNKVVSAEFSKGLAYRKMNLAPLALRVFDRVQKQYPGSPESFRAETESKLIRAN